MKYFVSVGERKVEVDLVERLGELSVCVDGQPVDVSYVEADRLGQVALVVGGRSYAVSISGDRNQAAVTVAGHLYAVEIEDEREQAARAAERARRKGGGDVTSVMPGVVIQLLVAEGDRVEEGQPLLILEAMKMQNEIPAPSAGIVKAIRVNEGEAIGSGAKLVLISES